MTVSRPKKLSAERPGRGEGFAYDEARHLVAYLHARELARGRDVLDAGCGEGFGTVLLAATARSVMGVDYAAEPIAVARTAYADRPNLAFQQLDVRALPKLARRFDLVTNFQVVEHLVDPVSFLTAVKGALAADGTLMITTPNRLMSVSENPVHVHEYIAEEFRALLAGVFTRVTQASVVGNEKVRAFDDERARQVRRLLRFDPLELRHRLPSSLVRFIFAQLSGVVRRRVAATAAVTRTIVPSDFTIVDESRADALDLVAFCRP
jgi:2-polyprenyl-3-methyl-5-hydroxy-6-metoxy-1,4-benzoquinol methylase